VNDNIIKKNIIVAINIITIISFENF